MNSDTNEAGVDGPQMAAGSQSSDREHRLRQLEVSLQNVISMVFAVTF